jgi:hypothetical protein
MIDQTKRTKRVHRVVLKFPMGLTHSVFIRAYTRSEAEKRALRQNPKSTGIDRSPYPQS